MLCLWEQFEDIGSRGLGQGSDLFPAFYTRPPQTSTEAQEASINRDLVWPPPRGSDKKTAIIICSDATLYYRSSQAGGDKKLMEVGLVVVRMPLCFTVAVAQWHSGTYIEELRHKRVY